MVNPIAPLGMAPGRRDFVNRMYLSLAFPKIFIPILTLMRRKNRIYRRCSIFINPGKITSLQRSLAEIRSTLIFLFIVINI